MTAGGLVTSRQRGRTLAHGRYRFAWRKCVHLFELKRPAWAVGRAEIDTGKVNSLAKPPISAVPKNVPAISVLIDTYNHERFIEKAIHSVLEQDFPVADREIIVVDDGSTDRTAQIVQRFERSLRYIRKENGGQASAFNIGIPECRGEIIAFLDGDDRRKLTNFG